VRVDLLRAHVAFASGLGRDAPSLLLKAARQLEPFDLDLARETYLAAWGAAGLAGQLSGRDLLLEICHAAQALPPPSGDPRPLDQLLHGVALLTTGGPAAAAATLQRAANVLTSIPVEDVLRWGWMATVASTVVWDFDSLHAISARQVQLVRDVGALAQLPIYLNQMGIVSPWMGDFAGTVAVIARPNMLAAIGMEAFAKRARRELVATGETVRKRGAETVTTLTPQEAHIARLARDGLTNPEIDAQLFLSARTVEWHLRKIFTKVGISSRRELHAAVARQGQDGQPA
jgi:DNA-binding CsgD family transcriptional regulator